MEKAKEKILKTISSCRNPYQLFGVLNMINGFIEQYTCQLTREQLSQAYRDKYKEFE